jgi:hypothetical protein
MSNEGSVRSFPLMCLALRMIKEGKSGNVCNEAADV